MRAKSLFLKGMSKLRNLIIKDLIRRVLVSAFLLSLVVNTIALVVKKIGLFHWEGYSIYAILVLVTFALCVLHTLRTKRSFMDELIEIDLRLGLKEKLSTAYECHQLGRKSIFVDLLTRDVGALLGSIKANQIFPRKFTPAHLLIPFFAGVIIILLLVDFTTTPPIQNTDSANRLKQIGVKMERYAKRELRDIEKAKKAVRRDLYRQMEKVGQDLKGRPMPGESLIKSLDELIKQAETERTQLARQLEAELSLGDTSIMPMLKSLRKDDIDLDDLEQLKNQLRELFEGEIPTSILQDISILDQNRRLELFLGKTMDEVRLALKEEGEPFFLEGEEDVFVGKASGKDSRHNKDIPPEQTLTALESKKANPIVPILPVLGRGKTGFAESEKDSPTSKRDLLSQAGLGKGTGEKKPPYELESSKSPTIKDKGISGQGDWYNVHVLSLPTAGKAKMKEEDVIRSYWQELEEVLLKEDIPLNYRVYIKNYFLSIGLRREEDRDDNTN